LQKEKKMQITNNTNATIPNFTSLRSVKYKGLYKKQYRELGQELFKTFTKNEAADKFLSEHEVDLVFNSRVHHQTGTTSSIHVIFDEPKETPIRRLINLFRHKKEIAIGKYENNYDIGLSIKASTEQLKEAMLERGASGSFHNGTLTHLIDRVNHR
jgi:hypothetical protein